VIAITNKKARQLYLQEMTRIMIRLENMQAMELKPILNRQFLTTAKFVRQGMRDAVDYAVDNERKRLLLSFSKHYRRVATTFGNKAFKIIEASKKFIFIPEIKSPKDEFWNELNLWMKTQAIQKVTGIQRTSKRLLRKIIQRGMDEGLSNADIAKNLVKKGRISTLFRAKTIAITETHTVAVKSVDAAIKSTRIEMEKEWVANIDKRTRPDHIDADTQRVPQNQDFTIGGVKMAYPGDPKGGADQVVRCRCVLMYHPVKRTDKLKPYVPEKLTIAEMIKNAEKEIAGNPFETLVAFDSKGNELFREKGGKSSVTISRSEMDLLRKTKNVIVTHNHPGDSSFPPLIF